MRGIACCVFEMPQSSSDFLLLENVQSPQRRYDESVLKGAEQRRLYGGTRDEQNQRSPTIDQRQSKIEEVFYSFCVVC